MISILRSYRDKYSSSASLMQACKEDAELISLIKTLSKRYLNRNVTGCSNCIMDAYLELITLKNETIMEKDNCLFSLKAGVLLGQDDIDNICSNANITNDLAIYHLNKRPDNIRFFSKFPENWTNLLSNPDEDNTLYVPDEILPDTEPDNIKQSSDSKRGRKKKVIVGE